MDIKYRLVEIDTSNTESVTYKTGDGRICIYRRNKTEPYQPKWYYLTDTFNCDIPGREDIYQCYKTLFFESNGDRFVYLADEKFYKLTPI